MDMENQRKPLIGIVGKMLLQKEKDYWHREESVDDLRYLIVENGGIAIILTPSEKTMSFNDSDLGDSTILSDEEIEDLHVQADLCDGLILQGGDYSFAYEEKLAAYAIEKDIPLLGICAGFNNILRALGSNTYEDRTKGHAHYDIDYRHHIDVKENTLLHELIGSKDYSVNSFHNMVVNKEKVEAYATINACSDDGLVEGFELKDKRFILALKWHPELMKEEAFTKRLFARFLKACEQ